MLNTSSTFLASYKEPVRHLTGKVSYELTTGTMYDILPEGKLVKFSIEKTAPSGKLFGFAVSQKITIETLNKIGGTTKGAKLAPFVGIKDSTENVELPYFYLSKNEYDPVKNTSVVEGYDIIHTSTAIIKDLTFTYPTTLAAYANTVAAYLGCTCEFEGIDFELTIAPNFDGTESIQTVLGAIAEASGTICYVKSGNIIKFRKMKYPSNNIDGNDRHDTLNTPHFFNFSSQDYVQVTQVAHATELGENIVYGEDGYGVVLWENPFLSLREDIATILESIGANIISMKGTPYHLEWRGNPGYEIGDYIRVVNKDGSSSHIYYLNETLTFDGGLRAVSDWSSADSGNVEAAPTTLKGIINKTSAKVDKVNQEIILLAQKIDSSDLSQIEQEMASLKITTNQISAEVAYLEQRAETTEDNMTTLTESVNATISSDNLSIIIQETMADGLSSVKTETGFTFDADGLTVSKDGAATHTQITENGMTVYNNNEEAVLTANAKGVEAKDLHARTYLIIGETSRFEDYTNEDGATRTGCFWIG